MAPCDTNIALEACAGLGVSSSLALPLPLPLLDLSPTRATLISVILLIPVLSYLRERISVLVRLVHGPSCLHYLPLSSVLAPYPVWPHCLEILNLVSSSLDF